MHLFIWSYAVQFLDTDEHGLCGRKVFRRENVPAMMKSVWSSLDISSSDLFIVSGNNHVEPTPESIMNA